MERRQAKEIIKKFIVEELIKNENDLYGEEYQKLYTSRGNEFIIYKKNQENSIYVKPKNGNQNFSESIDRILDYYIEKKTDHHSDKSYVIPISDYIFENKDNYKIQNEQEKEKSIKTKNIMLYGAPGVGKTHNYKRLISMIEKGSSSESEIFETIKNNDDIFNDEETFETIKKEKRVEFVTFHQSYSYEDFIEGFRPQEGNSIKLEDGIFKNLCNEAEINLLKSLNSEEVLFIDAINLLLKEKIENQESVRINLKRKDSYFNIYDFNDKTLYFEKQNGDKSHTLSIKTLEKMYYEETNSIINGGLAPYYNPILEELLKLKKKTNIDKTEQKNFYIVIDEINRGNISKIFGELITLIEEDKRDSYEVTLPYSKEKFKIPSNLYIIATMNSTDKSIATIDIALRRRFTFLKMYPNSDLVQYKQAKELMISLNQYIKEKLGEDYQLGHSYFMKISNDEELNFVKEYKIKPLLEEYFYAEDKTVDEILDVALTRKPTESLTAQEFMEEVEASN